MTFPETPDENLPVPGALREALAAYAAAMGLTADQGAEALRTVGAEQRFQDEANLTFIRQQGRVEEALDLSLVPYRFSCTFSVLKGTKEYQKSIRGETAINYEERADITVVRGLAGFVHRKTTEQTMLVWTQKNKEKPKGTAVTTEHNDSVLVGGAVHNTAGGNNKEHFRVVPVVRRLGPIALTTSRANRWDTPIETRELVADHAQVVAATMAFRDRSEVIFGTPYNLAANSKK